MTSAIDTWATPARQIGRMHTMLVSDGQLVNAQCRPFFGRNHYRRLLRMALITDVNAYFEFPASNAGIELLSPALQPTGPASYPQFHHLRASEPDALVNERGLSRE